MVRLAANLGIYYSYWVLNLSGDLNKDGEMRPWRQTPPFGMKINKSELISQIGLMIN
jgi:hypothetical protein